MEKGAEKKKVEAEGVTRLRAGLGIRKSVVAFLNLKGYRYEEAKGLLQSTFFVKCTRDQSDEMTRMLENLN